MGIGKNLKELAQSHLNKTAIFYKDEIITYGDFYRSIRLMQQHLLNDGHPKTPRRVAIFIGNEPAFLELFFAVVTLGWTAIPFDPQWSEREAEQMIQATAPDLIFTNRQFSENASYAPEAANDIETLKIPAGLNKSEAWADYDEEPFYLGFTSGSTGIPKVFSRNHKSWLTSFSAAEEVFQYQSDDVILAPGPLCYSLSLFAAVHALHIGATFHMIADLTWESLNEGGATVVYAVPTMIYRLIQQTGQPIRKPITFLIAGAKLHPEIRRQVETVFPASDVYEYYGASELSLVSYASQKTGRQYPESVGRPFPGVNITIRDQEKRLVPNGEIGEIFIESDFLFSGYVNDGEETDRVLTEYGATVGDLGYKNDDGMLTVIGRKKHMLISGGLNVYPEEVEKVIKEVETVKEAVVVGIADDDWGQKAVAFVKWRDDPQVKRLKAHCSAQLATYKRPKEFYEVERFPYTTTGKIARKKLESDITRYTPCRHL